ncbi:MAG TPA: hypothetical protein VLE50_08250, partial [Cellvibrio sp.]|nr:hypothetical protein [Cellvibrio sp.]
HLNKPGQKLPPASRLRGEKALQARLPVQFVPHQNQSTGTIQSQKLIGRIRAVPHGLMKQAQQAKPELNRQQLKVI